MTEVIVYTLPTLFPYITA